MRRSGALLLTLLLWAPVRLVAGPAPSATPLAVPFLPQTEALCGGAAAAMVFRYWGDRHADVQQFAPLVDRRAGGIDDGVLVRAVEARGWKTARVDPRSADDALATLRRHVEQGQPLILLIEDQPSRFHFVVIVGADDRQVWMHDPTWGPSRHMAREALMRRWAASRYWALLVLPDPARPRTAPGAPAPAGSPTTARGPAATVRDPDACDRAIGEAVASIAARGLESADDVLGAARARCPRSSRPISELAGVRFAQRRYGDALSLAEEALAVDRTDAYAWEVLASSRYLRDDQEGALRAWNAVGRPTLDSVAIEGLGSTRYASLARLLPLEPNTRLTATAFRLAARRVRALPTVTAARVSLAPDEDGWARVEVAVAERFVAPRGAAGWTLAAARVAAERELSVDVPGWNGEGELWSGRWRWWENRPRVGLALSAPAAGRPGGVWRVEGSWMSQRYRIRPVGAERVAGGSREARLAGGVAHSNWITPTLRYEASAVVGVWDGTRRAAGAGLELERRFASDRVEVVGAGRTWRTLGPGSDFRSGRLSAALRTDAPRGEDAAWTAQATVGLMAASARAPLSEWAGAGDADRQSPTLRAHPLTRRGTIDGPAFGRRLAFSAVEGRGWLPRPGLVRLGLAAFVDGARAWQRGDGDGEAGTTGGSWIVDGGIGLRVRWPGRDAVLRVDYARALRGGRSAVTVGWTR